MLEFELFKAEIFEVEVLMPPLFSPALKLLFAGAFVVGPGGAFNSGLTFCKLSLDTAFGVTLRPRVCKIFST